ncbi:MAG TPA: hypothetical protein VKU03_14545 [Roseiarcus sp.]|nr:hypothetical protein [Roseiarcus sp.]
MISDATLAQAVRDELISAAQADGLRALEAQTAASAAPAWAAAPTPDDESLRLVSGFGDVFVAIGLALFFGAAGFFVQHFFGRLAMWLAVAVLAWLLAEFFTRRRRMALPSIILLVVFAGCVFIALLQILTGSDLFASNNIIGVAKGGGEDRPIWLAGVATAGAAALHYWRFRVPITIAAGAAALAAAFVAFGLSLSLQPSRGLVSALVLVCGLAIFSLAMAFDGSDRERATRRTDIAFWLHLLAAPMIVHPVISTFVNDTSGVETGGAIAILVVFLVFALVAVAIDRRAMLVSGLVYAGVAFGSLLRQTGLSDMNIPATLLALGVFVLLLSAGWQPLRRAILRFFPSPLARRLPHPVRNPS